MLATVAVFDPSLLPEVSEDSSSNVIDITGLLDVESPALISSSSSNDTFEDFLNGFGQGECYYTHISRIQ